VRKLSRAEHRRQKTQRKQRITQQRAREISLPRNHRRLIDIAPIQMLAASDEIKLIAKIAVLAIG
jgi:hypothetical protein